MPPSKLGAALRRKFRTPADAMRALGLDAALLDEDEKETPMPKLSPAAQLARGALFTYLQPMLAQDARIDYQRLVSGINSRNYQARRPMLAKAVAQATDGKLAMDRDIEGLGNLLEAITPHIMAADNNTEPAPIAKLPSGMVARELGRRGDQASLPASSGPPMGAMPRDQLPELGPLNAAGAPPGGSISAQPAGPTPGEVTGPDQGDPAAALLHKVKGYLEEQGVSPEIINNLDGLLDSGDAAQDETENYAPPGIEDPSGTQIDPTPIGEGTVPGNQPEADDPEFPSGDAMPNNYVTRSAMDQAIRMAQDRAIHNQRQIREAERFVRPWVGDMALDANSPADVYRATLKALGVRNADKMHSDALKPVLEAQPKPGMQQRQHRQTQLAQDADGRGVNGSFAERFPDAGKIIIQ